MELMDEKSLLKRVKVLSSGRQLDQKHKGPVIFWMNRDQRVHDHWGLIYAQKQAETLHVPLVVVFCMVNHFLGAGASHYGFMLDGLKETAINLQEKGIPFHLIQGSPVNVLPEISKEWKIPLIVTDFNPLRIKVEWEQQVIEKVDCPVHQVDSHNIVPCWEASQKQEYAAYTFRPRILKQLNQYLVEYPELKEQKHKIDWPSDNEWIKHNETYHKENRWNPKSGSTAGLLTLKEFIGNNYKSYASLSNNPMESAVSKLSPYLHFGQVSPARCAIEVMKHAAVDEDRDSFLEQLIVRRELSDNFCYYQPLYDQPRSFPDWAKKTLAEHLNDTREYLYTKEELEGCKTHDSLWNAAQKEMKLTGSLHGYLRMYWAKKILEWSPNAETAQINAIYLNDTYLLDGRDPNGYTGIAWSIGGVHDRAWTERQVFGKIRYMNERGCRRKFDVDGYIDYIANLESAGGKPGEST